MDPLGGLTAAGAHPTPRLLVLCVGGPDETETVMAFALACGPETVLTVDPAPTPRGARLWHSLKEATAYFGDAAGPAYAVPADRWSAQDLRLRPGVTRPASWPGWTAGRGCGDAEGDDDEGAGRGAAGEDGPSSRTSRPYG